MRNKMHKNIRCASELDSITDDNISDDEKANDIISDETDLVVTVKEKEVEESMY